MSFKLFLFLALSVCNLKLYSDLGDYRIAGHFRWVLIFAISRTVYVVAKIKTVIIYSSRNSKVGSFISYVYTLTFRSRKFSSAKFSRYTVFRIKIIFCCQILIFNIA